MFNTALSAKQEAIQRRDDQSFLNFADAEGSCFEYAYSPSTFAVGIRSTNAKGEHDGIFRIFNIDYPMYGQDEKVTDWVSVGTEKHKPRPQFSAKMRARRTIPNLEGFSLIVFLNSGKLVLTTVFKDVLSYYDDTVHLNEECYFLADVDVVQVYGWYTEAEIRAEFGLGAFLTKFNCDDCGEYKATLPHCVFCKKIG